MFSSHEEMAVLFQNCVFDQYVNRTLNDKLDSQIAKANEICQELLADQANFDKIFSEKKIIGKSFNVKYLLFISKARYIISNISLDFFL